MFDRLFFPPVTSRRYPSLIADILIILGTLGFLALVARVGAGALTSFRPPEVVPHISLDPANLPYYAGRTVLRMFIALAFSMTLFDRLWISGCPLPAAGAGAHSAVGYPPICAGVGVPLDYDHRLYRPLSRQPAGLGSGCDFRHFYQPGLEYDLLVLRVAAYGPERSERSFHHLQAFTLALFPQDRAFLGDDRPDLECHDELWRRLVLCRSQRGDQRAQPELHAARDWLVCHGGY